ncbi:MAG: hypothetical protein EPO61_06990 [Nitrospirae bacterium]|nr:MAG: hypothetical protein EPO61_06990 [Nitrospirota bacterium]
MKREASDKPHADSPALDALLLFFLLNLSLQPLVEPDFGWHLRTGLDLLQNGWRMPATDPYSHTMPDWPWVDHAWLTDGFLALLYQGMGTVGPMAVIGLFAAVTLGAFWIVVGLAQASRTFKLLALSGSLWVALPFLGARTQLVTLLGLALLLRWFGLYRAGKLAHLWMVPGLFLLWANLHGGFTAGLFVLGLLLAASAVVRVAKDRGLSFTDHLYEPVLTWQQIAHLGLVILLAFGATFLNPYGWHLYGEIIASLNDTFMIQTLDEWHPVSLEKQAGLTYVVYLIALGLAVLAGYRRLEPVRWTILFVFLVLSLRHWRNVLFFLLLSLPLWAELLDGAWGKFCARFQLSPAWQKRCLFAATLAAALWVGSLGSDHLQHVAQSGLAPQRFFRRTEYPIEAVEWIKGHRAQLGQRMYNDYGHGGFLLWWLPGEKIFIDGRMPAFRIGDRWIFKDYMVLTNNNPPDLAVLEKYHVDWAIVSVGTPLSQALAKQPDWREVYLDAKVAIYVKRGEAGQQG